VCVIVRLCECHSWRTSRTLTCYSASCNRHASVWCVCLCACMWMFVFVCVREREREWEKESQRERERKIERVWVCVCMSVCAHVYTNWSTFENNSLTSVSHTLPSKHSFIVIPEWWSAKGEKTSFGNWTHTIPDKTVLLWLRVWLEYVSERTKTYIHHLYVYSYLHAHIYIYSKICMMCT